MEITTRKKNIFLMIILFVCVCGTAHGENPQLQHEIILDSQDASMIVRVGDMDNLGFGWPSGFDLFSGDLTPVHGYPWEVNPEDSDGTDRIMVVSGYSENSGKPSDGYTGSTTRPENYPEIISMTFPRPNFEITGASLQVFVDDFQAPVWGTAFQVTMNGIRVTEFENILNSLNQTGPVGNLITFELPDEISATLGTGELEISVDDPVTGAGDGFAFDFFRLLINPRSSSKTGTVWGIVYGTYTAEPLAGAEVKVVGGSLVSETGENGMFILRNVTPGIVAVQVSAPGYEPQVKTTNVVAGEISEIPIFIKLDPLEDASEDNFDELISIRGKILNSLTEASVENAQIRIFTSDFEETVLSASNGLFFFTNLAEGVYSAEISKPGFTTRQIGPFIFDPAFPITRNMLLEPRLPTITAETPKLEDFVGTEAWKVLFSVIVTDLDGNDDIKEVELSHPSLTGMLALGVEMERVSDPQLDEYTARYQYSILIPSGTDPRHYSLRVKATDKMNLTGYATIDFDVPQRIRLSLFKLELLSKKVNNGLDRQTLNISVKVGHDLFLDTDIDILEPQKRSGDNINSVIRETALPGATSEADCYVEVKIYRPDMTLYGSYEVYDSEDITIPCAESGEWTYETINYCSESIEVEIETRGANTGILAGKVQSSDMGIGIGDAFLSWSIGGEAVSEDSGYFSAVVIAGQGVLVSSASDYKINLRTDVSVSSGETKTVLVKLISEDVEPAGVPDTASVQEIVEPLSFPDPDVQPFAAGILGDSLVISAIFPAYESPVWIYLAMTSDYPDLAPYFFMFNTNDEIVVLEDTLPSWREACTDWQTAEPLLTLPVSALPEGGYTFYSLVTTDPVELKTFDLKYFTTILLP